MLNCLRTGWAHIVIASPYLFTYRVDNARNATRWVTGALKGGKNCSPLAFSRGAEIELLPMQSVYLALATDNKCQFVTADERFLRKIYQGGQGTLRARAVSLIEAVHL